MADLDPVRGPEQGGRRPVVVMSADTFNAGPGNLVYVVPLTTRDRGILCHVRISPPDGGLRKPSVARTDSLRSVARERLEVRWGVLEPTTMDQIEFWLRSLLEL